MHGETLKKKQIHGVWYLFTAMFTVSSDYAIIEAYANSGTAICM